METRVTSAQDAIARGEAARGKVAAAKARPALKPGAQLSPLSLIAIPAAAAHVILKKMDEEDPLGAVYTMAQHLGPVRLDHFAPGSTALGSLVLDPALSKEAYDKGMVSEELYQRILDKQAEHGVAGPAVAGR